MPPPAAASDISPKRKRAISDPTTPTIPFAPELNIHNISRTPSPPSTREPYIARISGADSPRTSVAHKFENLQIRPAIRPAFVFGAGGRSGSGGASHADQGVKRARGAELSLDRKLGSLSMTGQRIQDVEIPETPQPPQTQVDSRTTPRPLPDWKASPRPTNAKLLPTARRRVSSPPQPTGVLASAASITAATPADLQPLVGDFSDLVWHDFEITGHLVDPRTDPEDDGYGINGIGFKPTPATAWHRSQRRRQQITEWRAREAREARQQRARSRARGKEGRASTVRDAHRVVRFA